MLNNKLYFDNVNKNISDDRFVFMNHGYYPSYPQYTGIFKYSESLYYNILEGINKRGSIIDIGCGHGGGANLFKQLGFSNIHACDIVPSNIEYCKKIFPDISFIVANALNLPYKNNKFDVVTNVESSNYYGNYKKFYSEVKRILNDSGIFVYADIGANSNDYADHETGVKNKLKNLKKFFNNVTIVDISDNVSKALEFQYEEIKQVDDCPMKSFLINLYSSKIDGYKSKRIKYIKYICHNIP